MAWYRAGSVAVTNGGATVTGTGTQFNANVQPGHAINLPDGKVYEVLSVDSNTQITLGSPYLGGTASGQSYSVQPNQGFAQTATARLTEFLTQIGQWVAGPLAGRFADGSAGAPGMAFAADQDTGIRRYAENGLAIVTGGADRVFFDGTGRVGIGTPNPLAKFHVYQATSDPVYAAIGNTVGGTLIGSTASGLAQVLNYISGGVAFGAYNGGGTPTEYGRFDGAGNLMVGVTGATSHAIFKNGVGVGGPILQIASNTGDYTATFYGADQGGGNGSATALKLGKVGSSGRSLNAGGTLNASGADYAEYMLKAAGCGLIAKGDVCGVDHDGKLTKTWADAISFVVKSTDPSLVGGDTWSAHLPPRPTEPGAAPAEPVAPVFPADPHDDAALAAYREAADAYPAKLAAFNSALAEWKAATDQFAKDLAEWEAELEAARRCVDRIAFCGQVPCNVTGDFEVGDYIIAVASGAGIKASAVKPDDITLAQYMRRIGKVWAIRDGRAWIDVQHG